MKPNQEFIDMIGTLYHINGWQKTVSNDDLILHRDNDTFFYSMFEMTIKNLSIVKKTEPFSNATLIGIDKGANNTNIITENSETNYKRISPLEFTFQQGKGMLHWNVQDKYGQMFVIVKIMSDDGVVGFKFIKDDVSPFLIYNVCQLPPHFFPKDIRSILTQTR